MQKIEVLRCLAQVAVASALCRDGHAPGEAFEIAKLMDLRLLLDAEAPARGETMFFGLYDQQRSVHLVLPDIRAELAAICKEIENA